MSIKGLAEYIYDRVIRAEKRENHFLYSTAVREDLKTLYPMQNISKKQREFVIEKLTLGIMVFLIGLVLAVVLMIKEGTNPSIEQSQVERNAYGEGTSSIALWAENGAETASIQLELEEKDFSVEELEEGYDTFLESLEKQVLGENQSFEEIAYDLTLPESMEGYPFVMDWKLPEAYVSPEGRLLQNELEEPVVIELTVKIAYGTFEREETFLCCIRSRASPLSMQEQLQRQLEKLEEENREEEFLMLPTEYGGKEIVWTQQTERNGLLFLLATPLICVALLFSKDRDLHKRVEEREEQMKMDYPELVSKLALLLGAGMTVQNAWVKTASDYAKKKLPEDKKRYAYEEMLLTMNELKNGVYQNEALESFGRRCRLPCYNRLATLLTQNLRSGSTNLAALLQKETAEAFEERKHMARRQGEKAGTKLLFPMMLLLMIVMVIIIVPSFISFMG